MAGAARPVLGISSLVSPYLSRLSSSVSCQPIFRFISNFIPAQCNRVVPARMAFRLAKTGPIYSQLLGAAAAQSVGVNTGSAFGRAAICSACGPAQRPRTCRNFPKLTSSSSRSVCTAVQSGTGVDMADEPFSPSSRAIESPREFAVGGEGEAVSLIPSSGRKSKRICYYHSQGLCTMVRHILFLKSFTIGQTSSCKWRMPRPV